MITKEEVLEVFKAYLDPELHIDVWTLGLIYEYDVSEKADVFVKITFTSPMCPFGPQMVEELTQNIKNKGANGVKIEVTFDPAWKPSEELREMLGV
jgi:metal-sulfur cluster biosynthetic enzyme